jgi:hypothetical protein
MKSKSKKRKLARWKTKLGLPDLDHAKAAVLASLRSPESQRSYRHAITSLLDGIVQSLACPSTRQLSPVTGFTSKIADWRRELRM